MGEVMLVLKVGSVGEDNLQNNSELKTLFLQSTKNYKG
jgi:hypothetical protein